MLRELILRWRADPVVGTCTWDPEPPAPVHLGHSWSYSSRVSFVFNTEHAHSKIFFSITCQSSIFTHLTGPLRMWLCPTFVGCPCMHFIQTLKFIQTQSSFPLWTTWNLFYGPACNWDVEEQGSVSAAEPYISLWCGVSLTRPCLFPVIIPVQWWPRSEITIF